MTEVALAPDSAPRPPAVILQLLEKLGVPCHIRPDHPAHPAARRVQAALLEDAVGALLWGVGVTLLGFALGNIPFIKANIELLLVLVVAVSVLPIAVELWRKRRKAAAEARMLAAEIAGAEPGTPRP